MKKVSFLINKFLRIFFKETKTVALYTLICQTMLNLLNLTKYKQRFTYLLSTFHHNICTLRSKSVH